MLTPRARVLISQEHDELHKTHIIVTYTSAVHISPVPVPRHLRSRSLIVIGVEVRPEQREVCGKAVLPQYDLEFSKRDSGRLPKSASSCSTEAEGRVRSDWMPDMLHSFAKLLLRRSLYAL